MELSANIHILNLFGIPDAKMAGGVARARRRISFLRPYFFPCMAATRSCARQRARTRARIRDDGVQEPGIGVRERDGGAAGRRNAPAPQPADRLHRHHAREEEGSGRRHECRAGDRAFPEAGARHGNSPHIPETEALRHGGRLVYGHLHRGMLELPLTTHESICVCAKWHRS